MDAYCIVFYSFAIAILSVGFAKLATELVSFGSDGLVHCQVPSSHDDIECMFVWPLLPTHSIRCLLTRELCIFVDHSRELVCWVSPLDMPCSVFGHVGICVLVTSVLGGLLLWTIFGLLGLPCRHA